LKVLLTGFSGFLGRHLAQALRKSGFKLRILLNKTTVDRRDIDHEIEIIWGSIDNSKVIKRALNGIQKVVHSAWAPSYPLASIPGVNESYPGVPWQAIRQHQYKLL